MRTYVLHRERFMVSDAPRNTGARRNAATAAVVVALFLYPTSTIRGDQRREGEGLAPAGVVAQPGTAGGGMAGMGHGAGADESGKVRIVNGAAVDTAYGPVQVQVHVFEGEIISATAIAFPQESMVDKVLSADAIPALERAAIQAQSADIDTVSGATATSDGYKASLRAALDALHL